MPATEAFLRLVDCYAREEAYSAALKAASLAQWILESGRGTSALARQHHNYGGLKYRERMAGFASNVPHEAHDGLAGYCHFDNEEQFIKGYWQFIESGPYGGWEFFADDAAGYVRHVQKCGYCPEADYAAKVEALFPEACHLLRLDSETVLDEAGGRPPRLAYGNWAPPVIETVPGIRHKVQGKRPNGLEGLIVHFDAFRIRQAGNGPENSDQRSKQTLLFGQENGWGYGAISRTGRLFVPEGFSFDDWCHHAGESLCPVTGRAGVSRYYVGFECNNPGLLYECEEDGIFCPWYNSKHDPKTKKIIFKDHRVIRQSVDDEWYTKDQVRHVEKRGNIQPGWYLPFTAPQLEALLHLVCHLATANPSSFSVDRVLGHDEVAPGRKNDPGGALGSPGLVLPMEAFRQQVKAML